jgi:hypothetical protein
VRRIAFRPTPPLNQSIQNLPSVSRPCAVGKTAPSLVFDGTQYVMFRGADNHIHELKWG